MICQFAVVLAVLGLSGGFATVALADELQDNAKSLFEPIPLDPPAIPGNPASPAKVELGKMLYFDTRLSENHAISCNSCHQVGMGGVDLLETSIGYHGQRGARNAPTVLNAVFNTAQFWDGRAKDLQQQAGGPFFNPIEMAMPKGHLTEMLKGIPGYQQPFAAAFPGDADPISDDNVEKAIAIFEATLITPNAPFDKYLRGNGSALDATQKAGLQLFIEKGCVACHNGINVGGGMYAPFGVVERPGADLLPSGDKGRFEVTKTVSDEYVFKVPTLRNIVLTPPYFHTGKSWDLKQAVSVMGTAQLGIKLSDEEADQIVAFLGSLTGEQPQVTYPILPPTVATTPRPQP